VWRLGQVVGIGPVTAHTLVREFFGWRDFRNRREVGGASGLTGTPYDTGQSDREQGISKAGNDRVRRIAVELAWSWERRQPDSALTQWFKGRFRENGARHLRKGIVGLARKLLIALWRLAEHGIVPEGAKLKRGSTLAQAA
jgi:transposase